VLHFRLSLFCVLLGGAVGIASPKGGAKNLKVVGQSNERWGHSIQSKHNNVK